VTIDEIGASLDYTKSVVYYYFTSKNEILWQIFQRTMTATSRASARSARANLPPEEAMAQIIRRHALNVMEKRDWTAIYFREESELTDQQRKEIAKKKRQYDSMIEEVYEAGMESGVFKRFRSTSPSAACSACATGSMSGTRRRAPIRRSRSPTYCTSLLANGYLSKS
jgi:AcrR family transcriptional regulator